MHFVFVSTMSSYPWGGSEELWSQTAVRLREEGHQVSASIMFWPQLSPKVTALAGRRIGLRIRSNSVAARVLKKIQKRLVQTPREFAWLRQQKPDLVVISQGGNLDGL